MQPVFISRLVCMNFIKINFSGGIEILCAVRFFFKHSLCTDICNAYPYFASHKAQVYLNGCLRYITCNHKIVTIFNTK